MTTETIEIAYAAQVSYLAGKSRTPKRHFVPGSFAIEVPRLDPATVRRVASGARIRGGGDSEIVDVVASGDRTLTVFRVEAVRGKGADPKAGRSDLEGFRHRMGAPSRNGFYLFGHSDPWPRGDDGRPMPPDAKVVLEDGRPAMEALVRARVAGLAIHDGVVYCDQFEPVLNLKAAGGMDIIAGIEQGPDIKGYAFRLDRLDVAGRALERATCSGGYKSVGGTFTGADGAVAVAEPGALRFREDVHNARVAATYALAHLGNSLSWMPSDLIPKLHELALARDGLATGASEPDDVSRILGEFEDARERIGGRLVQLKHVLAIGRDMIAMSLRSEMAAKLDHDDAEALAGFAPG